MHGISPYADFVMNLAVINTELKLIDLTFNIDLVIDCVCGSICYTGTELLYYWQALYV